MYIDNEKYKKRLKQRGLTVNHLIDKTNTNRAQFYKYVNGTIKVDAEFILRLCRELVCPISYLTKK